MYSGLGFFFPGPCGLCTETSASLTARPGRRVLLADSPPGGSQEPILFTSPGISQAHLPGSRLLFFLIKVARARIPSQKGQPRVWMSSSRLCHCCARLCWQLDAGAHETQWGEVCQGPDHCSSAYRSPCCLRHLCVCVCESLSHVRLFATPWTEEQGSSPLSMGFSRQEYWSGLPFPSPGDLPDPGIKLVSPAIQADSLLLSHQGSPITFSFLQTLTPPRPYWAFRSPCCNAEWLPALGTWL